MADERKPTVNMNGVPFCSHEKCPQYDGKRCREMGMRPDHICEPAVIQLARDRADLSAIRSALDDWDWPGLLRDAEAGDYDSVVDALRTVVRVAEGGK